MNSALEARARSVVDEVYATLEVSLGRPVVSLSDSILELSSHYLNALDEIARLQELSELYEKALSSMAKAKSPGAKPKKCPTCGHASEHDTCQACGFNRVLNAYQERMTDETEGR